MNYFSFRLPSLLILIFFLTSLSLNAYDLTDDGENCDLFTTAISTEDTLTTEDNKIYGSCVISTGTLTDGKDLTCYEKNTNNQNTYKCSCDPQTEKCSDDNTCTIVADANETSYSHTFIGTSLTTTTTETAISVTFTDLKYGN